MSQIDVSLIIISLNSRDLLANCLDSIKSAGWRQVSYEVIVVDNGSADGTLELLADRYRDIILIANGENVGFCKAGNIGAGKARGRFLLFLNDDIVVLSDAICTLVEWMDKHPGAGIVGSHLLNADGTDQFCAGQASTMLGSVLLSQSLFARASSRSSEVEPYEVDWVSAAALMASREAFDKVDGLAEPLYYFHEHVLSKRMGKFGYKTYLHPRSRIIHFGGAGSGVRTKEIRRLHIRKFHRAAYDWCCTHYDISPYSPIRLLIAAALTVRVGALMLKESLRPEPDRVQAEIAVGRPSGGRAI